MIRTRGCICWTGMLLEYSVFPEPRPKGQARGKGASRSQLASVRLPAAPTCHCHVCLPITVQQGHASRSQFALVNRAPSRMRRFYGCIFWVSSFCCKPTCWAAGARGRDEFSYAMIQSSQIMVVVYTGILQAE
ncbi:hypothetical protein Mapa_013236 [Marchantia paleacea]|nr:hypothetical protein Mapa_013236 [Marchantia paleacea]